MFSTLYNYLPTRNKNTELEKNKEDEENGENEDFIEDDFLPECSGNNLYYHVLDRKQFLENHLEMFDEGINIDYYINELNTSGYTIIPNIFDENEISDYWSEFNKWHRCNPVISTHHTLLSSNGIYKYHQVAHQRFAWLARTNPKIINIFKELWNTDELVTSFDGCCYFPKYYNGEPTYWTHTDQSSQKKGVYGYQSFISLTNNSHRTLVVYEGSHLLHEKYFEEMNIDDPSDWNIIDEDYIETIKDSQRTLKVNAGDLVIWDSRIFHQNTCGDPYCDEERLVQYLCYLPKDNIGNTPEQRILRKNYYNRLRTTSHWPYPMNAVPKQPNGYNYYNYLNPIIIDYNYLSKPVLSDLKPKIEQLL